MHQRKLYTSQLMKFIDKPVVKVITGMRRVGKSALLRLLIEELREKGVQADQILYINMESYEHRLYLNPDEVYRAVKKSNSNKKRKLYLLIDEVQEIHAWEKLINALLSDELCDIVVTGSNAHLLSGELATHLTGRYVEFPIYTLSYAEYLTFRASKHSGALFKEYLLYGGLPGIHHMSFERDVIFQYNSSVFDSIILNDIVARHNIRNIAVLNKVIRFVADNIGSIISSKKVVDYLKKEMRPLGIETIYNYLSYLEDAFITHKVQRYDLKGKRLLEVHEKYYLGEPALRHALLGYRESDINDFLENIVFLELKRRGYQVYIGKWGNKEIDFVAEKSDHRLYFQVCYLLATQEVIQREFSPLLQISDNYPKFVLSMDDIWQDNYQGVIHLPIPKFLIDYQLPYDE